MIMAGHWAIHQYYVYHDMRLDIESDFGYWNIVIWHRPKCSLVLVLKDALHVA